ncbi:DUF262 domain-containing protein [Empedobacter brevis]|uniref:DUF262 domain-containing protein n=1 Tax=Empedobacter brevis TaxID=247 RepID=UPI0033412443
MNDLYFEANKVTIGQTYLEPNNIFKIPRFQRPYSWEENQIDDFWETINADYPTFLGTVIYNIEEDIVDIIDGQQRYMTITIFGTVLRDYLWSRRKDDNSEEFRKPVRAFHKKFIGKEDDFDSENTLFYLEPNDNIKDFFTKYIHPLPFDNNDSILDEKFTKNSSESRIQNAYKRFWSLIEESEINLQIKGFSETTEYLRKLLKKLSNLFFVRIDIKSDEFAYEIFETVNARGVDLSVSDLIKNQIFKNVDGNSDNYLDIAKAKWDELSDNLSQTNFSLKELISYYWTSKYTYISDKKLYIEIKKEFGNDKDKWKKFLFELLESSELLELITNGSKSDLIDKFQLNNNEINYLFESLNVLRNLSGKTWIILYLSMFRNYAKVKENYNVNLFWKKFEHFTFHYSYISKQPSNWYFKFISDSAKNLEKSLMHENTLDNINKYFDELYKEMDSKKVQKDLFIEEFKSLKYKNDSKTKSILKYIFKNIEIKLSNKFSEGFDEQLINIEHILPQTPTKWGLNKNEIKNYVHQLGNLIIVTSHSNIIMSNEILDEKMKYFEKSTLNLSKEFVDKNKNGIWKFSDISRRDYNAINNRTTHLAEISHTIWG